MDTKESLSRRTLMRFVGVVGVGGVAAACAPVVQQAAPAGQATAPCATPLMAGAKVEDIQKKIQENFEQFLSDPDYKTGIDKLDKPKVHELFESTKKNYTNFIAFYVYRRQMKVLKALEGKLADDQEKALRERGDQALTAYTKMVDDLKNINDMWSSSGVGQAIDRHAESVFQYLDYNPKTPPIIDEFRDMGVPEGSICWLFGAMMDKNFNILRVKEMDGTFSDIVKRAEPLIPKLKESVLVMKQHGLPIIEGAGSDEDEYVEAGVVTGVAIIVGLIFGFCHDWRPLSLPHVLYWDS